MSEYQIKLHLHDKVYEGLRVDEVAKDEVVKEIKDLFSENISYMLFHLYTGGVVLLPKEAFEHMHIAIERL